MYSVCIAVRICLRMILRYGCTIGNPSFVVQTTVVICNFLNNFIELPSGWSGCSFSSGTDFAISLAQMLSQSWMPLAPVNASPIEASTF